MRWISFLLAVQLDQFVADDVLQLVAVLLETSDSLRQEVGSHFTLVHLVPEALLRCVDFLQEKIFHFLCGELDWHLTVRYS